MDKGANYIEYIDPSLKQITLGPDSLMTIDQVTKSAKKLFDEHFKDETFGKSLGG